MKTYEELFNSLMNHISSLSLSQRSIIELMPLGHRDSGQLIILNLLDNWVESHKQAEMEMLEEMGKHYTKECESRCTRCGKKAEISCGESGTTIASCPQCNVAWFVRINTGCGL